MEPVEYVRLIRRRWRVVAACCLISAVAVWVTSPAAPQVRLPEFVAKHTIIREEVDNMPTMQAVPTVALMVRTGEVPRRVAKRVGYTRDPVLLAGNVTVEIDAQLGTLIVQATANGRQAASDVANAFGEETLAYLGERAQQAQEKTNADLVARITKRQATINDLERQRNEASAGGRPSELIDAQRDAELRLYSADLELQQKQADLPPPSAGYVTIEEASPERASPKGAGFAVPTSRPMRAGVAAVVGMILGAIVVLVVERVDPRINLRATAEKAFGLPVIAEVPFAGRNRRPEVLTVTEPSSGVAEAYRGLRAALLLIPAQVLGDGEPAGGLGKRTADRPSPVTVPNILGPTGLGPVAAGGAGKNANGVGHDHGVPQVVLVTSAAPSEGKTATVANLAAGFAEAGRSVLVLSCDFRRPAIHQNLGVRQAWGLTDVLDTGPDAPKLSDVVKDSVIPGVRIATNGAPLENFGEVAAAGRKVIADARRLADIVLVDTAPLLVAHEATELIPAADTVVVVCRSGQTTREDAGRTRELLTRLGAPVAGVVLLGAPDSETGYSTYYSAAPVVHRRRFLHRRPGRSSARSDDVAPALPEKARNRAVI